MQKLWDRFFGFSSLRSKADNIYSYETTKNELIYNKLIKCYEIWLSEKSEKKETRWTLLTRDSYNEVEVKFKFEGYF